MKLIFRSRLLGLAALLTLAACHDHDDPARSIGGTIAGLTASGLVLQNNGGDDLAVAANATTFEFSTQVENGATYAVTILTLPEGQVCELAHGTGVTTSSVSTVEVSCRDVFTLTATSGTNGSIFPDGEVVVDSGSDQQYVATPESDFVVLEWRVDGAVVQSGGATYSLSDINADHTVEVSFGQTTLTPSLSALALAVNDTARSAALTGTARQVSFTNTGPFAATNLSITYPSLPVGTVASSTCGTTLAVASTCTITITPSAAETSGCSAGTVAAPGAVTVSADNAPDTETGVVVLTYGCIYQDGFVFSIDDSTPGTETVGGKVASQGDQVSDPGRGAGPPGIIWSSTGANGYDGGVSIWGIDQTSTAVAPSPNGVTADAPATQVTGQENCSGGSDGDCNSRNILLWYSAPNTTPTVDPSYYAAGMCTLPIDGHSDWYLPAACEMGPDSGNNICPVGVNTVQNMASNLPLLSQPSCVGNTCLNGDYWTSTEEAAIPAVSAPDAPQVSAWIQTYTAGIHAHGSHGKGELYGVRCARHIR